MTKARIPPLRALQLRARTSSSAETSSDTNSEDDNRDITGTAPLTWLTHQRVLRAQQLLESTGLPVEEVARRCGFSSAAAENANPGSEGITRSKATAGSRPCARGSVSGPMTSRYSATEPGQPCVRISGTAPGSGDLTCRKWMSCPSISVRYCG